MPQGSGDVYTEETWRNRWLHDNWRTLPEAIKMLKRANKAEALEEEAQRLFRAIATLDAEKQGLQQKVDELEKGMKLFCLLYTSPSPRDRG